MGHSVQGHYYSLFLIACFILIIFRWRYDLDYQNLRIIFIIRIYMKIKSLFLAYAVLCGLIMITTFFLWPWAKWSPAENNVLITESSGIISEDRTHFSEANEGNGDLKPDDYWTALKRNVLNLHYLYIVAFIPLMICNGNFFLATSNQQLALVSKNHDTLNLYAEILGILIPTVGIIVAPFGLLFDKYGINSSIYFFVYCCILSTALGVVRNLPLQIFRFIIFSIYYPYTYTVWADFITKTFGLETFGVQFGIVAAVSGIEQFALTSVVNYAIQTNNFDWINIVWIFITLLGLIYPLATIWGNNPIPKNKSIQFE